MASSTPLSARCSSIAVRTQAIRPCLRVLGLFLTQCSWLIAVETFRQDDTDMIAAIEDKAQTRVGEWAKPKGREFSDRVGWRVNGNGTGLVASATAGKHTRNPPAACDAQATF